MAKAASKKQAAQNAMMVKILTYGFLASNLIHVLLVFGPFRNRQKSLFWPILKYSFSELFAGALGLTLRGMAKQGDDLAQQGLTAYMFDVIYVTWFVHITTAIISAKCWYIYAVIPGYALVAAYTKLIVPFLFKGNDPIASLFNRKGGSSSTNAATPSASNGGDTALSKRQAKLQKRAERGDPRVQMRSQ